MPSLLHFLKVARAQLIAAPLIAAACLLAANLAYGFEVRDDYYLLSNKFDYLVDEAGTLSLKDVQSAQYQQAFRSSANSKPSLKGSSTPLWLKLQLDSPSDVMREYILGNMSGYFNEIRIYRPRSDGSYDEYITGNRYPASQREMRSPRYNFHLQLSGSQTIYLRVEGRRNTQNLPWHLIEKEKYTQQDPLYWTVNLLTIGALLGVLAFNAGIGATLGNKRYLFYSLYIFTGALALSELDGLAFLILWPEAPAFNHYSGVALLLAVAALRLLAITHFLNIKRYAVKLHIVASVWSYAVLLLALTACFVDIRQLIPFFAAGIWLSSFLFGLGMLVHAMYRRVLHAIPIFLILLLPAVGSILQTQVELGAFSLQGPFGGKMLIAQTTFLLHALLFSIYLALQIRHEVNARIDAQHDALTGLPSLTLAKDRFNNAAAMSKRYKWQLAILFIDLDRFKAVNDTYGHEMGDKLLIEVAARLKACVRETDTVARIGGDEFMVIQTEVKTVAAISRVAENIIQTLEKPFRIDAIDLQIGSSIGVSLYPESGAELNQLLKEADTAMYAAKKNGRNSYHIANSAAAASQADLS